MELTDDYHKLPLPENVALPFSESPRCNPVHPMMTTFKILWTSGCLALVVNGPTEEWKFLLSGTGLALLWTFIETRRKGFRDATLKMIATLVAGLAAPSLVVKLGWIAADVAGDWAYWFGGSFMFGSLGWAIVKFLRDKITKKAQLQEEETTVQVTKTISKAHLDSPSNY